MTETEKEILVESEYDFGSSINPVPWIYENFLATGDLCVWVGKEKSKKSSLVLQLAVSAATGRDFLGFQFQPSGPLKVRFVSYEDDDEFIRRAQTMMASMQLSQAEEQLVRSNLYGINVISYIRKGLDFPRFPSAQWQTEAVEFWTKKIIYQKDGSLFDIYILDPLRCVHNAPENDSGKMEAFFRTLRRFLGNRAVILPHHARKHYPNSEPLKLKNDMRLWSDEVRGSGAIKAHADLICCQEIEDPEGDESIRWGAFGKRIADISPSSLLETDIESFYWERDTKLSPALTAALSVLQNHGGPFINKKVAAQTVSLKRNISARQAYHQIKQLLLYKKLHLSGSTVTV